MIKILKCEICGKECKNESSLKSHYSKSHEDNILIDNNLKCKNPNCNNSIIKKYIVIIVRIIQHQFLNVAFF